MKMNSRIFFFFSVFVLAGYFIFGLFCLDVPYVRPDEAWITSRIDFLIKYHRVGDPLFPKELSPFFAALFNAVPGSEFLGLIRYYSQAAFIFMLPIHDIFALRTASFAWSILLCLMTYIFAKKTGQDKRTALLSVACLIIIPEFFSQLHTERPEIMIAAAYMAGLLLFMRCLEMEEGWGKRFSFFLCGLYAWAMVIMIHGNAVIIPVTFGILYFLKEYKRLFTLNTVFLGASLIAGFAAYYYLLYAPQVISGMNEGGKGVMESQAPPIISKGIKSIFILPYLFYKKLAGYNQFAKPLSMLVFLAACASLYFLRKKKSSLSFLKLPEIATGIFIPAICLLLLSGSNGKFLVIIFPLCAVLIGSAVSIFTMQGTSVKKSAAITGILSLVFLAGFQGISRQGVYTKEYFRVLEEVDKTITDTTATVIGSNFYYFDFKNQPFYSAGALNPVAGKPGMSFEQAVKAVSADYLILDDFTVNKIYGARGKGWTDSMFTFIDDKCGLIREINANQYVGFITGDPRKQDTYPAQWKYPEQKLYYITRIRIYKVEAGQ